MADLTFSTHDFRSSTQESKRRANRKHKWHLGSTERVGRPVGNPRPHRPSETSFNQTRRETKGAVASLASGAKLARKQDIVEGTTLNALLVLDDSSPASSDIDSEAPSSLPDAGVTYSFDASRGPSQGGEILNVALARAMEKFEEKETARLVRDEYDVVDLDAEDRVPFKKGKGRVKVEPALILEDDDEDYEFI